MKKKFHFFNENFGLNFDPISLFTTLYSFAWLRNGTMVGIFKYAQWILRGLKKNLNRNVKKDFQNPLVAKLCFWPIYNTNIIQSLQ
jgi:hypothetical protein